MSGSGCLLCGSGCLRCGLFTSGNRNMMMTPATMLNSVTANMYQPAAVADLPVVMVIACSGWHSWERMQKLHMTMNLWQER